MKKIVLCTLLLQNLLFGCAACQLMTPTAHVSINVDMEKDTAKNIHIIWIFSKIFSNEVIAQYDKDRNKLLDKNELNAVRKAMLDYLVKKEMLTTVKYADKDTDAKIIKPKYKNFEIAMQEGALVFSYDSVIDLNIRDRSSLYLVFQDDEGYFNFKVAGLHMNGSDLHYDENLYLFTASLSFSTIPFADAAPMNTSVLVQQNEQVKTKNTASLQVNLLKESIGKIKSLFESIKDERNPFTYLFLLLFAYLYGVVHALGPGHGKTLVASYFLSNERSYSKALSISVAIGFVHTFSAFLLTLAIYFVVDTFLAQFVKDTVLFTTKISALVIISIAVYLLYKKYKAYKELRKRKKTPAYSFSASLHVATCGCAACKVDSRSTDAALIISAGIIPCPGTTAIFVFAISLGLYYAGFLSAFVMSLGMSTVIFFSALLSVFVRKKTLNMNGHIKQYLEYASLVLILILGVFLFIV